MGREEQEMVVKFLPICDGDLQCNGPAYPDRIYDQKWVYDSETMPRGEYRTVDTEWRPNEPFHSVLDFAGFEHNRSTVRVWWSDPAGHRYPMFFSDFEDLIRNGHLTPGTVSGIGTHTKGHWLGKKHGANYGIYRVDS
jgi:hypothetical protein